MYGKIEKGISQICSSLAKPRSRMERQPAAAAATAFELHDFTAGFLGLDALEKTGIGVWCRHQEGQ